MALTKLGLASFPSQTEPFRVPLIRRKVGAAALGENSDLLLAAHTGGRPLMGMLPSFWSGEGRGNGGKRRRGRSRGQWGRGKGEVGRGEERKREIEGTQEGRRKE